MGCGGSSPAHIEEAEPPLKPSAAPGVAPSATEPAARDRALTSRSLEMVETLETLESEIQEMQARSNAADDALEKGEIPIGMRSDLAALHGSANKLLATRLDAIVTADLTTGRDEARAKRKALVAASEALIERTEQQVVRIDRLKELPLDPAAAPSSL